MRTRAVLLLAVPMLIASSARAADVAVTDEARAHFQSGVNLLRDPDGARYEDAYREFKAAYAASPSYKILGNLGLCALKLERDGEAIDAYEEYLKHSADLDPTEAAQIKTDLSTLTNGVVHLTIKVDKPGAVVTDTRTPTRGDRVVNVYGPVSGAIEIGVRAGHHQFVVQLPDYEDVRWELDGAPGGHINKEITLRPVKSETSPAPTVSQPISTAPAPVVSHGRPLPTGFYIGLAATGALAAGATVTGILALKNGSDFNAINNGRHVSDAESLRSDANRFNLMNDILVGGAVIAAGITGYFYFARPPASNDKHGRVDIVPVVSPQGGALMVTGRMF